MKKRAIESIPYIPAIKARKNNAYTASVQITDIKEQSTCLLTYTKTPRRAERHPS